MNNQQKKIGKIVLIWVVSGILSVANSFAYSEQNKSTTRNYSLSFDKDLSMFTGSHTLNSLWKGYISLEDEMPSLKGDSFAVKMGRIFKLTLLDYSVFSQIPKLIQHEFFGHGARTREFNINITFYNFDFLSNIMFVPNGIGFILARGITLPSIDMQSKPMINKAAFLTAGIEATRVLALGIVENWLKKQIIDYRDGVLFLQSNYDQSNYVQITSPIFHFGDISDYIQLVNFWLKKPVLNLNKLKNSIWVDYLDPFFLYSLIAMDKYIETGNKSWQFPMLQFGKVGYLPGFRIVLAPFGLEYQMLHYLHLNNSIFIAETRYGENANNKSFAFGVLAHDIYRLNNRTSFGIKLNLWQQPRFTTPVTDGKSKLGGLITAKLSFNFNKAFQGFFDVGYKTEGFVQGEVLRKSLLFRVGGVFEF